MKNWIALVLAAALAFWQLPSQAQARVFNQAELDALLAPVALYPDPVLSNILIAATYPEDLQQAAAWSRANPQLTGENAVRAAEPIPWHPSVKALLAFPELLVRMDESKQWTADLGAAFREQEPYVMDTVQGLRRRAQASGSLQSNDQYSVQQQGSSIAVYPAQPQVVYVPYYDPYVVYGPWWWPAYRPVFWRPWYAHPTVFVSTTTFVHRSVDWHRRHVVRHFPHHPAPVRHGHPPAAQQAHAPQHWRNQQQWREQQQRWREQQQPQDRTPPAQAAPPSRAGPAPQSRPAVAHDQHSGQQWSDQQPRWRDQQQRGREQQRPDVRAPRTNPPAPPVPSTNMPQPVRPMGVPVRPISDTVRIQPQPRPTEVRREVHGDRRVQAAPPVMVHNQMRARPIIDSGRAVVESIRPHFEQRSQHRQANQQQQRRQASQPQRRG